MLTVPSCLAERLSDIRVLASMSLIPDSSPVENPSLEDAEEACRDLQAQVERAKKVLRDYRATLGGEPSDNDNRRRR